MLSHRKAGKFPQKTQTGILCSRCARGQLQVWAEKGKKSPNQAARALSVAQAQFKRGLGLCPPVCRSRSAGRAAGLSGCTEREREKERSPVAPQSPSPCPGPRSPGRPARPGAAAAAAVAGGAPAPPPWCGAAPPLSGTGCPALSPPRRRPGPAHPPGHRPGSVSIHPPGHRRGAAGIHPQRLRCGRVAFPSSKAVSGAAGTSGQRAGAPWQHPRLWLGQDHPRQAGKPFPSLGPSPQLGIPFSSSCTTSQSLHPFSESQNAFPSYCTPSAVWLPLLQLLHSLPSPVSPKETQEVLGSPSYGSSRIPPKRRRSSREGQAMAEGLQPSHNPSQAPVSLLLQPE